MWAYGMLRALLSLWIRASRSAQASIAIEGCDVDRQIAKQITKPNRFVYTHIHIYIYIYVYVLRGSLPGENGAERDTTLQDTNLAGVPNTFDDGEKNIANANLDF